MENLIQLLFFLLTIEISLTQIQPPNDDWMSVTEVGQVWCYIADTTNNETIASKYSQTGSGQTIVMGNSAANWDVKFPFNQFPGYLTEGKDVQCWIRIDLNMKEVTQSYDFIAVNDNTDSTFLNKLEGVLKWKITKESAALCTWIPQIDVDAAASAIKEAITDGTGLDNSNNHVVYGSGVINVFGIGLLALILIMIF